MTARVALIVQQIVTVMSAPEDQDELVGLVAALAAQHTEGLVRILVPQQAEGPRNLTPAEAAKVLGTSVRWMYRHAHELDCTRRPSPGKLRFDSAGIQRLRDRR